MSLSRGGARRELAIWLGGAVVAAVVLVGTVVALGGRVEAATWGLVVAAAAMVFALRSLYRMATALARPPVEAVLDELDVAAYAGKRELREERRRLLRAINELQFDYEMGKLSEEDYRKVRQGYELQAVEVIRALDAESELHPGLAAELRRRGLVTDGEAKPAETKLASAPESKPAEAKPAEAKLASESSRETETTKPDPIVPSELTTASELAAISELAAASDPAALSELPATSELAVASEAAAASETAASEPATPSEPATTSEPAEETQA